MCKCRYVNYRLVQLYVIYQNSEIKAVNVNGEPRKIATAVISTAVSSTDTQV